MVGSQPSSPWEAPAAAPPPWSRQMNYYGEPMPRPCPWLTIVGAWTAVAATAALIVPLARPTVVRASATTAPPTYRVLQIAAAQQQLCGTYKLAAREVQVDTSGGSAAFVRIPLTNAAVVLGSAAADSALYARSPRYRASLNANAYLADTAKRSEGPATEPEFRRTVGDVNAKGAAMERVCGGS